MPPHVDSRSALPQPGGGREPAPYCLVGHGRDRAPDFLGHIAHPPADESMPYNPGDIYQQTKMEGEELAAIRSKALVDLAAKTPTSILAMVA